MRDEIEVMRVLRVPPMGKLVVQAGGERLESLSETKNEKVKHRLLAAIGELISFSGGYQVLVDAGVAPPLAAAPAPPGATVEESLNEEQAAFLDQLERELKANNTSTATPEAMLAEEIEPDQVVSPPEPGDAQLNLVAEIDAILQKHVEADPQLAQRSIHLEQPPGGLLRIRVDGQQYEHPNDIEDGNVRQALKQALKEWESR
ncbi:MAG TPA: hypothetical protein VK879_17445 [Candidatus Sulfomarinibacteraceae bacterium]|nr:hypothetical protein [Candidatus Sulfomarinibacteraceae bacterium]